MVPGLLGGQQQWQDGVLVAVDEVAEAQKLDSLLLIFFEPGGQFL